VSTFEQMRVLEDYMENDMRAPAHLQPAAELEEDRKEEKIGACSVSLSFGLYSFTLHR